MKLKAASCGVTSAVAPLEYLIYVVEPNLAALAAEYGDIRHNLNFVHSLDALAAHVYYASNGAAPGRDDEEEEFIEPSLFPI